MIKIVPENPYVKWSLASLIGLFFLGYFTAVYWSFEADVFDPITRANQEAREQNVKPVTGYVTTSALVYVGETLLEKSGGYLSNDIMPPSVFMDNMPAWEFGVLEMTRDLSLVLRNDFSRSQSQSTENAELAAAQNHFNIDNSSWALPSAEGEYELALESIKKYRSGLVQTQNPTVQFYARADNLREWLKLVEKRLGSMSQRLSASVGQERLNTDLAGDSAASQSTYAPAQQRVKTSWWKLDDVFYEARGVSWALIHFLKAVEVDFADVLEKKNALVSLRQIIRELEQTQQTVWSPMILNGSGFGLVANHSLVMANYISRANAALIDLNELLAQG